MNNIGNQSQDLATGSIETLRAAAEAADGQPCVVGRELDVEIAVRVMGYEWREMSKRKRELCAPSGKRVAWEEGKERNYIGIMFHKPELPEFSTDIAAAMEVENRIAELGLQQDYVEALESEIAVWHEADAKDKFMLIHATPEQRCRAALRAVSQAAR